MITLNIDPANKQTAYVLIHTVGDKILDKGIIPNDEFVKYAKETEYNIMNLEIVANMGLSGVSLYDTSEMVGVLSFIAQERNIVLNRYKRHSIKKHMGVRGRRKVNGQWVKPPSSDSQIRTSLIEKYGEVGRKASPGYFYGFARDMWQAMAVYDTWRYGDNVETFDFILGGEND